MAERTNQITANIGLYWVCAHLSRRGWNVMPTSRNTRGIDIVVYKEGKPELIGVQVKTLWRKSPVGLGKTKANIGKHGDAYWVIVCNAGSAPESFKPECYVLLPREVRRLAKRKERDGRVSFWLQPKDYRKDKFREKWERIK